MVEIEITYTGDLHTKCVHGPSKSELLTDAPVDNQGKGEKFSPTDLVGTAMGSCMLTIMGIAAKNKNIALEGAGVRVRKFMITGAKRRIGRLELDFTMPAHLTAEQRKLMENAADTCPVRRSLHPDVEVAVNFEYEKR